MSRMEMIFSWLKYRNSFISRRVRRQNIEWSNGVIFLIATFCPEGLCMAELRDVSRLRIGATVSYSSPDNAVGAFSDDILNIVLV